MRVPSLVLDEPRAVRTAQVSASARHFRSPASRLSSLLLQLHRQLIDLRGQDEIVLRQAADRVRRKFDGDLAVAGQVQVGMMVLRLRNLADALEEVKSGRESP